MSHRLALLAIGVAACGPGNRTGTTGNVDPGARACPPAAAVRVASFRTAAPDDGYGGATYGLPGSTHWQVPLKLYQQEYDQDYNPVGAPQQSGPRTEAEVRILVDGPIGGDAWVYTHRGQPACRGRIASYYMTRVEGDGGTYDLLAAEVDGCPAQDGEDWSFPAYAVLGADATGCSLATPERIELHDGTYDDASNTFRMPELATALPATIAGAFPRPACEGGPCQPLWFVTRAGAGGHYVYDASVAWVVPTDEDSCSWPIQMSRELLLGTDSAATAAAITADGIDWDTGEPAAVEINVELDGVLYDAGGPRLVLTDVPGMYGVHEIESGRLGAGAMHGYYLAHEEEYLEPLVGPGCGL